MWLGSRAFLAYSYSRSRLSSVTEGTSRVHSRRTLLIGQKGGEQTPGIFDADLAQVPREAPLLNAAGDRPLVHRQRRERGAQDELVEDSRPERHVREDVEGALDHRQV